MQRRPVRRRTAGSWLAALLCLASGAGLSAAAPSWSIALLYGAEELYPSALLGVTERANFPPRHPSQLGDPVGVIAAEITAPADDFRVRVTLAPTAISEPSSVEVILPRAGETYRVAPVLALRHEDARALHHAIARELLVMTVAWDGGLETRQLPVRIAPVHDALLFIRQPEWIEPCTDPKTWLDTKYLLASFVNENDPEIVPRVLNAALDTGIVDRFDGYASGTPSQVRRQVEAVYQGMKKLGLKYSNLYKPSTPYNEDTSMVISQRVRYATDTLTARQANCVDGSVLLAAVLTRVGIRTTLLITPNHVLISVRLDPEGREQIRVETTEVGESGFSTALREGNRRYRAAGGAKAELQFRNEPAVAYRERPGVRTIMLVDVWTARANGIVSLADASPRPAAAPPPALE